MATRDHRDKKTARAGGRAGRDGVPASIFTTPGSDIVPGELLVVLEDATAAAVTESIAVGPTRGLRAPAASSFGVSALDTAIKQLKVTSITRLHPPAPVVSEAMTEAATMASTFRMSFDASTPVATAVQKLSGVSGVSHVEPNRYRETYVTPNDPSFAAQWGLAKINCPAAWDRTTGNPSVVVAVIDTGVDLDHPELAPLLVPGNDLVDLGSNPTAPPGFRFEGDFQGRDTNPQDEVGHGTHVAGTIACLSNNATGVAGVTWQCHIMPVRVLARIVNIANPSDVRGTGSAADIAAGIRWAVDNGARVLNLSLGGSVDTTVEREAIAYAIAHGAVVVAAMGNGGAAASPSFPGAYPDVVAVGAIDQADHRASFSQVGPHIDVVGPGVGVLSTVWNNGFTTMSGTSMATPHVAGVAALVLSCNSGLTGAQVADILRQTARPLRDNPADPVPNDNYGFGCVDAKAAVNRACPTRVSQPIVCVRPTTILCRPTMPIHCRLTTPITCRVSTPITCRVSQLITCRPTNPITCRITQPIFCRPSVTIPCPSGSIICRPSALVGCPSGPICGIHGPIENPFGLDPSGEMGWDPSGAMEAWGGEGWSEYDPYGDDYGGEGCGGCGEGR